jgi:hypothetical protein
VRQAARIQGASETTGSAPGVKAPASTGGLNLGEPRKVRTVSIRPDGSVVGAEAPAPIAPAGTSAAAPARPAMPSTAMALAHPGQGPSATPTAQPRVVPLTPAQPAASTPATSTASAPATNPPAQPPAAPAAPAPQRVASAQPAPVVAPPAPAAPEVAATGGFAVQLGVSPSEADAKATLQKLSQKYADLGRQSPMIRKAEVNGNTVFRVRVGPMSKDDAASLCTKLQGQGGQCFLAKN